MPGVHIGVVKKSPKTYCVDIESLAKSSTRSDENLALFPVAALPNFVRKACRHRLFRSRAVYPEVIYTLILALTIRLEIKCEWVYRYQDIFWTGCSPGRHGSDQKILEIEQGWYHCPFPLKQSWKTQRSSPLLAACAQNWLGLGAQ